MVERTVYLGVQETDEHYVIGPIERQRSIPWCVTHDSKAQQTICESYDLVSRRIGRNPFGGKPKCIIRDGEAWLTVKEGDDGAT